MKNINKRWIIIFVILVLLSFFIVDKMLIEPSRFLRQDYENDIIRLTKESMRYMSGNIKLYAFDSKNNIPKNWEELYRKLIQYNRSGMEFVNNMYDKKILESGIYHDAWGTPIKLKVNSPREYCFISYGPNLKSDKGGGDDIFLFLILLK